MNPFNILVVDDDRNLAVTLANGLQKELGEEISTQVCFSGAKALTLMAMYPFDLVISDFNMPGVSGLVLFQWIRNAWPQTHLVMITAYGTDELEKEVRLLADNYITKPFDLTILVEFIRYLIGGIEAAEKSRRVLLLEDDFHIRGLFNKVLSNAGFAVNEAPTLREAEVFLESCRFDIFIADIHLPDGHGTDLVKKYRELLTRNRTAVILTTVEAGYRYLEEDLGIDMYLEKPIAVQDLVTFVQRWATVRESQEKEL